MWRDNTKVTQKGWIPSEELTSHHNKQLCPKRQYSLDLHHMRIPLLDAK